MKKIRHAILVDLKKERESIKEHIVTRVSKDSAFKGEDVWHEIDMLKDEGYITSRQTANNTYWFRLKEKGEEYFLPCTKRTMLYIGRHWPELVTLVGVTIAAIGTIIQLCRGQ